MSLPVPEISVIMPTFNRSALLRRSVLSVLAQTHRDFELIVVDDASPDDTAAVLSEFSDPRLHVIRRTRNGRAAAARNDGLAVARGRFIAFQDDDDIWLPHKLERQRAALLSQSTEVGLVVCSYLRLSPGGVRYIGGDYHFRRLDFSRGNPLGIDYGLIATPGWLVRREVLERTGGFDARFRSWDDWELGLRIWKEARLFHVDEPLFIQDHVLGSAMMRNEPAFSHDMRIILEKHGALWTSRHLKAEHCFIVGKGECRFHSLQEGRTWLLQSLRHNPLHLRALGVLLASGLGQGGVDTITRFFRRLLAPLRRLLKPRHATPTGGSR